VGFVQSADVFQGGAYVVGAGATEGGGEAEAVFVVGGRAAPGLPPEGLRGCAEVGVGGAGVV